MVGAKRTVLAVIGPVGGKRTQSLGRGVYVVGVTLWAQNCLEFMKSRWMKGRGYRRFAVIGDIYSVLVDIVSRARLALTWFTMDASRPPVSFHSSVLLTIIPLRELPRSNRISPQKSLAVR